MTHANLERQPIFQGGAEIFAPHPCHRVRTDTEKKKYGALRGLNETTGTY